MLRNTCCTSATAARARPPQGEGEARPTGGRPPRTGASAGAQLHTPAPQPRPRATPPILSTTEKEMGKRLRINHASRMDVPGKPTPFGLDSMRRMD